MFAELRMFLLNSILLFDTWEKALSLYQKESAFQHYAAEMLCQAYFLNSIQKTPTEKLAAYCGIFNWVLWIAHYTYIGNALVPSLQWVHRDKNELIEIHLFSMQKAIANSNYGY